MLKPLIIPNEKYAELGQDRETLWLWPACKVCERIKYPSKVPCPKAPGKLCVFEDKPQMIGPVYGMDLPSNKDFNRGADGRLKP